MQAQGGKEFCNKIMHHHQPPPALPSAPVLPSITHPSRAAAMVSPSSSPGLRGPSQSLSELKLHFRFEGNGLGMTHLGPPCPQRTLQYLEAKGPGASNGLNSRGRGVDLHTGCGLIPKEWKYMSLLSQRSVGLVLGCGVPFCYGLICFSSFAPTPF